MRQKWTKIQLLPLDIPTNPPASRAKKAPSEVQILSPCHSTKLDRNFDRNADNHQRTTVNIDERQTAPEATGRTPRNLQKQSSSYPPSDPYAITACHLKSLSGT